MNRDSKHVEGTFCVKEYDNDKYQMYWVECSISVRKKKDIIDFACKKTETNLDGLYKFFDIERYIKYIYQHKWTEEDVLRVKVKNKRFIALKPLFIPKEAYEVYMFAKEHLLFKISKNAKVISTTNKTLYQNMLVSGNDIAKKEDRIDTMFIPNEYALCDFLDLYYVNKNKKVLNAIGIKTKHSFETRECHCFNEDYCYEYPKIESIPLFIDGVKGKLDLRKQINDRVYIDNSEINEFYCNGTCDLNFDNCVFSQKAIKQILTQYCRDNDNILVSFRMCHNLVIEDVEMNDTNIPFFGFYTCENLNIKNSKLYINSRITFDRCENLDITNTKLNKIRSKWWVSTVYLNKCTYNDLYKIKEQCGDGVEIERTT